MPPFEYDKFIIVLENKPQPIVTLDDEKLLANYGNPFATLCVTLLLTANYLQGLSSGGDKNPEKEKKLLETKQALIKCEVEGFDPDKLLSAVEVRRNLEKISRFAFRSGKL